LSWFSELIRGFSDARKGFRWSLYLVHKDRGFLYALHENAVFVLLGYVLGKIESGKHIAPDWKLFINFNWEHKSIELLEEYFQNEEISPALIQKISDVDPGWMVAGGKPVFVEVKTGNQIPLGSSYDSVFEPNRNEELFVKQLLEGKLVEPKISFATVFREVFQK
jgi:hypothetical protein